ncbi:MAG: glutamine--tRNA ligase/YqeY domain fusion protein [Pseudomonadota bacterium]|nr:glutamine--tRNA ligase/YqeY domain fusion protein [Pseudomonadota bacterium]MED5299549.1 glutamine--tRNA ligase/YqeY domain fusion protein [Pseudomonadota bacterium]MEE3006905.1 glutamine--tRNA ligase/YqeY domain fusion protein [Pseudomonadota bacterium]
MSDEASIEDRTPSDFIREQIYSDLKSGKYKQIVTRFPPEPNGYLHIGHALSICLNFGIAEEVNGICNLRFDDTNPAKEELEFIKSIEEDVRWLGFDWSGQTKYASDNFHQFFEWAVYLIKRGLAYVDDLTADEIREYRGTLTEVGRDSPYRNRSAEENLQIFHDMRDGKFQEGERVLRAKIDMGSGNINLRDPVIYRILNAHHPRTGDTWCVYPTYDFAHGQTDALEGVTHSLCTLEFADHRPLYEWFIEALPVPSEPKQYEFAKLQISHTVLSKRNLTRLVMEQHVSGWDDPRLPTLSGLRRRGVPAEAIKDFVARVSVSKNEGEVELALLEHCIRDNLNYSAERRLAVLKPLKVVIDNFPEGKIEWLPALNKPNSDKQEQREIPFSREIWIEQDDFMEEPSKKFFRLAPGKEVRLRYAFFVTCNAVIKDEDGEIVELRCSYDPETRGGNAPDGRKVKGTIHWVSAEHAKDAEVRIYNSFYNTPSPGRERDFIEDINPNSLEVLENCKIEPDLIALDDNVPIQFERLGYFYKDSDTTPEKHIYNRTISLRDTWNKKL